MVDFRGVIERVVEQQNESLESDFSVYVDPDEEAIENLSIEKQGDILIVCQYGTKRGDIMLDPMVRVNISEGIWVPIEYRNDYLSKRQRDENGIDIDDFLSNWATNLEHHFL